MYLMLKPDKKDYDFNDPFESLKFIREMIIYTNELEKEIEFLKGLFLKTNGTG